MSSPERQVSDSMLTETSMPASNADGGGQPPDPAPTLIGRITRVEIVIGALIAAVVLVLVLIEPDILEAPFQNGRTLLFTFGGTAVAAIGFVVMLWLRVPPIIRVIALVVPFVIVNWWLLSPYFVDDVVDESFSTSISEQLVTADDTPVADTAGDAPAPAAGAAPEVAPPPTAADAPAPATAAPEVAPDDTGTAGSEPAPAGDAVPVEPSATAEPSGGEPTETAAPPATAPVLLGAGQFVGLAGHSGTGDAGIFRNPDGSLVLRFENFDIDNGPDLEVYLVPGPGQTSLAEGAVHLGSLEGNVGDQNYELPPGTELAPGTYTALVWCEAFSVEFVGATIKI
jgi:hypothetical protein